MEKEDTGNNSRHNRYLPKIQYQNTNKRWQQITSILELLVTFQEADSNLTLLDYYTCNYLVYKPYWICDKLMYFLM